MEAVDFWRDQNGMRHITPRGEPNPEGEWLGGYLKDIDDEFDAVVDFGCGPGRLSVLFDPKLYFGLDVNTRALKIAKARNPDHSFRHIKKLGGIFGDVILCHTVLLHIPDHALERTIASFQAPVVIVNEITGRHWRREHGEPPVFNREPIEYRKAFKKFGYKAKPMRTKPYEHYLGIPMSLMRFEKC